MSVTSVSALRTWRSLLLLLLLCGCVSVEPLQGDTPPVLGTDEGILVLHIESEVQLDRIVFDTSVPLVRNLPPGEHLLLFVVTAGGHRWSEVVLPGTRQWGGVRFPERILLGDPLGRVATLRVVRVTPAPELATEDFSPSWLD